MTNPQDAGVWPGAFGIHFPNDVAEEDKEVEEEKASESAPVRMTAPHGSLQFAMSQHVACLAGNYRAFMEGKIPLPEACRDGHPKPPTPQERGLIS